MATNKIGGLNGFKSDFYGNDFTWFIAFVEEVHEAEIPYDKLNRVKIRIWGLHDFDAPLSTLPLASIMMPTTVGGVHNNSAIFGLEKGAQVVGFWLDKHKQHPVIIGSLLGISPPPQKSTSDVSSAVLLAQATTEGDDTTFAELPAQDADEFLA